MVGVCPRLHSEFSDVCPWLKVLTNAHTHTHTHTLLPTLFCNIMLKMDAAAFISGNYMYREVKGRKWRTCLLTSSSHVV